MYERVWRHADVYRNPDHHLVQLVHLRGRFHYEYATVDDGALKLREWNVRRVRLGVVSRLLRELTLLVEMELNPQERDPLYTRLTHVNVEWSRSPAFAVRFGKVPARFTLDGSYSSNEQLALDRGALTSNIWFAEQYMPGVSVSGTESGWVYQAGVFSAGAANREFGTFTGTGFVLATLGYDFGGALGGDGALLRGSYVYQDPNPDNTFTLPYRHVGSVNGVLSWGRVALRGDLAAASGTMGQPDVRGAMIMPVLDVTRRFQVLARYTHVESDGPNGIALTAYEETLVPGRGDRYREIYLGANYYLYGHKLKLQSGVQFGDMHDRVADGGVYSGVAVTTGLRASW